MSFQHGCEGAARCSWLDGAPQHLVSALGCSCSSRLIENHCVDWGWIFFGFLFNAKILLRRERTGSAASGELGTAALDVALSSAKSEALPRHLRLLAPPPSALLFHTLDENSSSLFPRCADQSPSPTRIIFSILYRSADALIRPVDWNSLVGV